MLTIHAVENTQTETRTTPVLTEGTGRRVEFDYLRAVFFEFVTWLQYGLLGIDLSAITKATLVFAGTLLLSWGLIAAIRRIPAVARVI
jgi:hypothetical protein